MLNVCLVFFHVLWHYVLQCWCGTLISRCNSSTTRLCWSFYWFTFEGQTVKATSYSRWGAKLQSCTVGCTRSGFSEAARGAPAYSGSRRKGSAELLPHGARTTQLQCCLPRLPKQHFMISLLCNKVRQAHVTQVDLTYKDSPPASWSQCTAQYGGPPYCQRTP